MNEKRKIGIVIQARMGSTRLPGKMMLDLNGKPVLEQLLHRMREVRDTALIVATSRLSQDDVLAEKCEALGVATVRGDSEDVLSRYVTAADQYHLDVLVRLTGDCPLMDPATVASMIQEFLGGDYDYYCNLRPRSFPRGLDCEIFTKELLCRAYEERNSEDCPEYVVIPFVNRHEKELRIGNFKDSRDFSNLRWTLDEESDYRLIRIIYKELQAQKTVFGYEDVLKLIQRKPELTRINDNVRQKSI